MPVPVCRTAYCCVPHLFVLACWRSASVCLRFSCKLIAPHHSHARFVGRAGGMYFSDPDLQCQRLLMLPVRSPGTSVPSYHASSCSFVCSAGGKSLAVLPSMITSSSSRRYASLETWPFNNTCGILAWETWQKQARRILSAS